MQVLDAENTLYCVTCVSNPQRYKSRYALYRMFADYMAKFSNVVLYTVELAFNDRPFEITDANNHRHIQVRSNQEIWHKENLMNIGLSRLPADAKYVAWIDADVTFNRPDWAEETIMQLHHYDLVQMFSEYTDLGPEYQTLGTDVGFVKAWKEDQTIIDKDYNGLKGATGLAWAARRETLNKIGGLLDWCVIGSGDWHMAYCLMGKGVEIAESWFSAGYRNLLEKYQRNCNLYIKGNIGYVNTSALHYWHGPKSNRGYNWRWKIIREHNFDPVLDLTYDTQGVLVVTEEKHEMLYKLREYFQSRKEDSHNLD